MSDIVVNKHDEATTFVECDSRIANEISRFFTVQAPNYRWSPAFKAGRWDGKLRYFDFKNHLPIGLVERLKAFARQGGYSIEVKWRESIDVSFEEFEMFVKSLEITDGDGNPMELRDYQIVSAYEAVTKKHLCMEVPTAGGKTVIMYVIARFFEKIGKRLLCVVPSVQLVEQGYSDFFSYGWENLQEYVHLIYAGRKKDTYCPIVISTWQSLLPKIKEDPEYFTQFNGILVDEAHGAQATSLRDICKLTTKCEWRLGLSGTFPEDKTADRYTIEGGLGPVKKFTTYEELQKNGHIAGIKIYTVVLKYPLHVKKKCYEESQGDYGKETDFIISLPERNELIKKLVSTFENNGLVLFTKIEKHGEPLKRVLEEIESKRVLYMDGSVDVKERESMRMLAERRDDLILLCSYGVFSTGISVKNIHHIVFASGYKSRIKVLQSIGRGLRLHKNKTHLVLIDLVDDLSFTSKADDIRYVNHSVRHFKERSKIYSDQGFSHQWISRDIEIERS